MRIALAWLCFALGFAAYGLLAAWLLNLGGDGISHIPQKLFSLGWEAAVYGLGLLVAGAAFLIAGGIFHGSRRPRR